MKRDKSINQLFAKEIEVLEKSSKTIKKKDISRESLISEYDLLNKYYSKLLKEIITLTKLSDNTQKKLIMTNEQIEKQKDELKKANEVIRFKSEELKESTAQLIQSEKLTALGELTAGIAHELNQPLNVIKIVNQLLLNDMRKKIFREEKFAERFEDIKEEINKMAEIIDHMRIFTRRSPEMQYEDIDLNLLLQSALKFFRQQLIIHDIELLMEQDTDLPYIIGDRIRLEQVIINLITNARKALEESGKNNKKIIIRTYKLDAQKSSLKKESVVIEVKDNATGVPPHLVNKIFEPFFTTKLPKEGTGLGLSISNKIIEEHKGKIELENNIGEGAIFKIILPEGVIK